MRALVTGNENKTKGMQWFWRWLFYILGLATLALGLILNTKAQLGVSPIISVAYSTSVIAGWNFGNATLVLYVLFVIAEFILKGKNRQWIDVFQIVLSILFTRVINIFDRYIRKWESQRIYSMWAVSSVRSSSALFLSTGWSE